MTLSTNSTNISKLKNESEYALSAFYLRAICFITWIPLQVFMAQFLYFGSGHFAKENLKRADFTFSDC